MERPTITAEDLHAEEEEELRVGVMESLKEDVNAFLWVRLPGKTTLREAEDISIRMCELIVDQWK